MVGKSTQVDNTLSGTGESGVRENKGEGGKKKTTTTRSTQFKNNIFGHLSVIPMDKKFSSKVGKQVKSKTCARSLPGVALHSDESLVFMVLQPGFPALGRGSGPALMADGDFRVSRAVDREYSLVTAGSPSHRGLVQVLKSRWHI